jgi:hypothetical protein
MFLPGPVAGTAAALSGFNTLNRFFCNFTFFL